VSNTSSSDNNKGRKIRLFGRKISEDELHAYVKKLIDEKNITGTSAIAREIGKTPRHTKRILDQMAFLKIIEVDPITNRLIKTQEQIDLSSYTSLKQKKFNEIREIQTFISEAKARGVKLNTLRGYCSTLRQIFNFMKTHPRVPIVSRNSAIEFGKNLKKAYVTENPQRKETPQHWRVTLRVYLDSVGGISFGHGMAKGHGFGSHHGKFGAYAGVHIPIPVCKKLQKLMLDAKDYEAHTFFSLGIFTGGRTGANSSMTWERVHLDESDFILYQHETKDDGAGHIHLGTAGEWKKKTPPMELLTILKDWRDRNPKKSRFLWFEDKGNDISNRKAISKFKHEIIPKLRKYLEQVRSDLDALTQEYIFVAGEVGHVNRHTFAQLLRERGLSSAQIANAGGWKSAEIVDKWYTSISKKETEETRIVLNSLMDENINEKDSVVS